MGKRFDLLFGVAPSVIGFAGQAPRRGVYFFSDTRSTNWLWAEPAGGVTVVTTARRCLGHGIRTPILAHNMRLSIAV